jgi:hypothetical protein
MRTITKLAGELIVSIVVAIFDKIGTVLIKRRERKLRKNI